MLEIRETRQAAVQMLKCLSIGLVVGDWGEEVGRLLDKENETVCDSQRAGGAGAARRGCEDVGRAPSLQHSQAHVHSCVPWLALLSARSAACHGPVIIACVQQGALLKHPISVPWETWSPCRTHTL